ncbi:1-aminocyclopropane-1-carboxylate synthase-like protein 1 [Hoplias malabaricus]|uniref:1-aminocyclopropane-1-carboxylate synthase-like protein 1 n=1 Tax=Hoplias malabaricus TaxID=27720 RepID=UPI0034628184
MDLLGKKYERGSNWSEPEVVELLQLWSDEATQSELESCLRNQHVFNRIATALHARGVYRTGEQCREKIKKLKLEYRRIKENQYQNQTQKTVRGGARAWRFYEVMDRVLNGRPVQLQQLQQLHQMPQLPQQQRLLHAPAASSCSSITELQPLLPGQAASSCSSVTERQPLLPAPAVSSCSSVSEPFTFTQLLDIKREELHAEDASPELIYHIGSEDEHESKSVPAETEELALGEGVTAQAGSSPSAFSDHNVAGSSSAGISPATAPMVIRDGSIHGDVENPKSSMLFRQRKRRRASGGMGGGRLLERALAEFLGWQQVMEERYLSLEEARLQQEARQEERREHQEDRRAQKDREHELRLLSLVTGALAAARGTADSINTSSCNQGLIPAAPAATESMSVTETPSSPAPLQGPSPSPVTSPFTTSMQRDDQMPQPSLSLSRRGNSIRQHEGILQEGYRKYHANKHDENTNPDGIINMGTSENKLCFDLLQERLSRPDMLHMESSLLQYPDWKGHGFLREEVARFLSEHCRSPCPLNSENVVVMNGCSSVFCALAAVLCDHDDAILIPTPFYGVISEDVDLYCGVKLYCVPLDSEASESDDRPFHLTVEKLEHALERAKKEGVNVRAIILVNPHNPLGEIYTAEEMTSFLNFAKRHELHAIVDEVYMLSVFDEDDTFHSVLSLERIPDAQRTHVMWGISKDLAMAGMRVGTVYSENRDLVDALDHLGNFHGVPGRTQHQVAQLLRDKEWINGVFLLENRRRLKEAHCCVTTQLKKLSIPYLHRGGGFFIWADFRKYLKEHTFAEELCLWRCFLKHSVLLSCGQAFQCSSPGWFRIIFSDHQQRLQLGLERIRETLEELQGFSILPDPENQKTDKQQGHKKMERTQTTDKTNEGNAKGITTGAFNVPTKVHCEGSSAEAESFILADEDTVVSNCQSSSSSETLDSLIGALRQQIQSSDWLEKNRPQLAAGEDPTQLDVFKDLLDKARI